ncbi:MAG: CapA family protein [Ruminococcaceae bacterium]|nr:CapA family protein [Oscillospiraceae bacterium]
MPPVTVPETTAPETTAPPTTVPETTEPEPQEVRYTLTFAGDCTLASDPGNYGSVHGFIKTIGEDYGYPFRNVLDYFENDDFTIINLESVLADEGYASNKLFTFRGPTAYTQIMTGSSVEAVTLANNHTLDYGQKGYDSTIQALTDAEVWFVEENKTTLVTTESGLTIGLYADSFNFTTADIQKNVQQLRNQGAEIVICAFHWGTEGSYRPTAAQKNFGHTAIDAGADVVYGHHPHVLQPIEEYNGGYIFYSLGNFSFGGNHFPRDLDSALVQLTVIRDEKGKISLGELTRIPVSITSMAVQNNFQPTPYEEGTKEYDRTLSKLDGSFTGPDLNVNYDHLKPTEAPTEPPAATEAPAAPTDAPETQPPATQPPATQPPATQPPAAQPPATQPPAPPAEEPDPS